jgi:lysozyme family protein
MSDNFMQAYKITNAHEGGWHDASGVNSADRGGETFKGIARKIHSTWAGWPLVDALKNKAGFPNTALNDTNIQRLVHEFYKREFWDSLRLDELNNQMVRMELFDTSVNCGTGTAARFLQRSLNMLNRNQRSWPEIPVSGIVGPITIKAFNDRSANDQRAVFNLLNILQAQHYINIVERNATQEEFLRGWLTRVELIRNAA